MSDQIYPVNHDHDCHEVADAFDTCIPFVGICDKPIWRGHFVIKMATDTSTPRPSRAMAEAVRLSADFYHSRSSSNGAPQLRRYSEELPNANFL